MSDAVPRRLERAARALAVAVAIVPCLPGLTARYGFSDDYTFLSYEQSSGDLLRELSRNGRPLLAIVYVVGRAGVGDIGGLAWARLFGVLGIALLTTTAFRVSRRAGQPLGFAFAFAAGVGLLPGVQLSGAWASCAPFGYASAAALWAASASDAGRSRGHRLLAVAALVAALSLYQPAAGFFVVGVALGLLVETPANRARLRAAAEVGAVAVAVALGWLLLAHLALAPGGERTGLTHEPGRKVRWFFGVALRNATNLWDVTPSHAVQVAVGALALAGMIVVPRKRAASVALVFAVPVVYLPNLVSAETWAAYRTLPALSALVWAAALAFVTAYARRAPRPLVVGGLAAATLAVTAHMARLIDHALVTPQQRELARAEALVREALAEPRPLVLAVRQVAGGVHGTVRYDELGVPSLSKEWVPTALVRAIARDEGLSLDGVTLVRLPYGAPVPDGTRLVDADATA